MTQPASLDAILRARKTTPILGVADRAYTWDIGSQCSAGAQAGDLVLQVVLSTNFFPAAATTQLLKIAVSHL